MHGHGSSRVQENEAARGRQHASGQQVQGEGSGISPPREGRPHAYQVTKKYRKGSDPGSPRHGNLHLNCIAYRSVRLEDGIPLLPPASVQMRSECLSKSRAKRQETLSRHRLGEDTSMKASSGADPQV